jgi:hypothetical protein
MYLEQVVQRVATTWTAGGRVGVLSTSSLKHGGNRYVHIKGIVIMEEVCGS